MKQLTLRGVDRATAAKLREVAEQRGISLSEAALVLLREGAGLGREVRTGTVGDSLDHLAGTWREDEADAFLESLEVFGEIDDALWS